MSPFRAYFPWFIFGAIIVFPHILRCITELLYGCIFIWDQSGTLPDFLGFLSPVILRASSNQDHSSLKRAGKGCSQSWVCSCPLPTPLTPYPSPHFLCPLNTFPLLIFLVLFYFKLTSAGHLLMPGSALHVLYPLSQSFSPPRKKLINTLMARNARQIRLNGFTLGYFSGNQT